LPAYQHLRGRRGRPELRLLIAELLGPDWESGEVGCEQGKAIRQDHAGGGLACYVPTAADLLPILGERLAPAVTGDATALHRRVRRP